MAHIMPWKRRPPGPPPESVCEIRPGDPPAAVLPAAAGRPMTGFDRVFRRRAWRQAMADRKGVTALETAVILSVLLTVMLGIINTGILFNNFLQLNNLVRVTSRVLAASRGSGTPFTNATTAGYASAPSLTKASITLTLTVAGAGCSVDGACATSLTNNPGGTSSVSASYPCNMTFMGVNFIPGCTLSSSTAERIE